MASTVSSLASPAGAKARSHPGVPVRGEESRWSPAAEALLPAAARANQGRHYPPRARAGPLCCPTASSTFARILRGGAGGLSIERGCDIYRFRLRRHPAHRTLVLALADGGVNARARDIEGSDRIGGRSADYHAKAEAAFRIIAAEEPERVRPVDASGPARAGDRTPARGNRGPVGDAAAILGQDRAVEQFASA